MSIEAVSWDRALARERMRRLREAGSTSHDKAYRRALAELRQMHRADFLKLYDEALKEIEA